MALRPAIKRQMRAASTHTPIVAGIAIPCHPCPFIWTNAAQPKANPATTTKPKTPAENQAVQRGCFPPVNPLQTPTGTIAAQPTNGDQKLSLAAIRAFILSISGISHSALKPTMILERYHSDQL